jgi:hypothetical protein
MAEFLAGAAAAGRLEQLVADARERLVLVSPDVPLARALRERLHQAVRRGVALTVVHGRPTLAAAQRRELARVGALSLRRLESLRVRCYASERGLLLTSLGLHAPVAAPAAAEGHDLGVWLDAREPAFHDGWREVEAIVAAARPDEGGAATGATVGVAAPAPRWITQAHPARATPPGARRGHCIRCRRAVPLDRGRPLCLNCHRVWAQFGDPEYAERWCHDCGRDDEATCMARPFCVGCFVGVAVS